MSAAQLPPPPAASATCTPAHVYMASYGVAAVSHPENSASTRRLVSLLLTPSPGRHNFIDELQEAGLCLHTLPSDNIIARGRLWEGGRLCDWFQPDWDEGE